MLKKIILTFLCSILIITASCENNDTEGIIRFENSEIQVAEKISNDEIITLPIMLGSNFDTFSDEEYKNMWIEFIKNEFKLELEVVDTYNRFKFYDGTYMKSVLNMNAARGLVYMPSAAVGTLYELVEEGEILPLQTILEQNSTWNDLPEEMKKMYEFEGDIWAVPSEFTYAVYTRKVNKEWLREIGYSAPENLDELYEVCKAFTFEDPDDDGTDNTIGASVYLPCVIDIFNVFDCRLQPVSNGVQVTSIAYNEKSGIFEDCVNNSGMEEALIYIKTLVTSGMSDLGNRSTFGTFASFQESFTHDIYQSADYKTVNEKFSKELGMFSSNFSLWLMSGKKNYAYTEKIFTEYEHVLSLNDKATNPVFYNYSGGFYVMDANAYNPEISLNRFVYIFMGNQKAYTTGCLGLENEGVTYVHNELSLNKLPPVIGRLPGLYDEKYDDISGVFNEDTEQARRNLSIRLREFTESDRGYNLYPRAGYGVYEKIPFGAFGTDASGRTTIGDPMMKLFLNMYNSIMNTYNPVSIADAIAQYNIEAQKAGISDYLQEINEKIGK